MIYLYIIALVLILIYIYREMMKPINNWKKKGVKLGNMPVFPKDSFVQALQNVYLKYPRERYVGIYRFLLIKDPDLIKKITVKEFDTFSEHRSFVSDDIDPLWNKNLFSMKSDKWRKMRPTLSPAFTGNKMRSMFQLMEECAHQFVNYLKDQKQIIFEAEVKDLYTRYTNDVIATSAFGIKCDSFKEPNNSFYLMGKKATNFSGFRSIPFLIDSISPTLIKILKLKIIPKDCAEYFANIIEDSLKARRENGIVRQDMINLLLEAQKGKLVHEKKEETETCFPTIQESERKIPEASPITDFDITAQAFVFFLAGFDTTSTLMTFLAYELAVNTDVQERLSQEISQTWEKCGGNVTYEAILQMKYLDMVISETLRKWPPAPVADRKAIRDFTIEPERDEERPLLLEKDTICMIPIYALHLDPQYYSDPYKFDPERFSNENKHKINQSTYLPFGLGPRNCIGSRFALLENKILFFHLLRAFEIVPVEKTHIPMVLDPRNLVIAAKGGMWLGFKPRSN